ncbi:hypothetical protein [Flavobacterium sp. GT3R68]|uniref:hypothetical protein n=1 Tax=Flavobacterium sp. GT3R68 TaxID=2594437 RepID=UPI00163DA269|nr:hypothetical protein [Flavobacterium sp. GT3R68]
MKVKILKSFIVFIIGIFLRATERKSHGTKIALLKLLNVTQKIIIVTQIAQQFQNGSGFIKKDPINKLSIGSEVI